MKKKPNVKPVKWEGIITNIQGNILCQLARYKFLTLSQLLQLNVGTTQYKYLWKQMASLRDRKTPLVSQQRFSMVKRINNAPPQRIEDWYFLNTAGKRALEEELFFEGEINIPSRKSNIANKDYFHRRHTIDFRIALDLWAIEKQVSVPFFDCYYDRALNRQQDKKIRAKTRIDFSDNDYFIPDGAFKIIHSQDERFCLMEMYQGNDLKRTITQLHKHGLAMTQRYTHKAYKLPSDKSYLVILIFEHQSLMNAVINRIKEEKEIFGGIAKYFRCKTLNSLSNAHFNIGWKTLLGQELNLFNFRKASNGKPKDAL